MSEKGDMSPSEFKRLTAKRDRLTRESRAMREGSRERLRAEAELDGVKAKLNRLFASGGGARGMIVTEHAMVRFVERVMGVSVEEFAERVLPAVMRRSLVDSGVRDATVPVPVSGGSGEVSHRAVIVDGVVVSVLAPQETGRTGQKPATTARRVPRSMSKDIERDMEDQCVAGEDCWPTNPEAGGTPAPPRTLAPPEIGQEAGETPAPPRTPAPPETPAPPRTPAPFREPVL